MANPKAKKKLRLGMAGFIYILKDNNNKYIKQFFVSYFNSPRMEFVCSIFRVPKCLILCAGGFDCSIIAQKMYESQQTNFAIKENKTVNSLP